MKRLGLKMILLCFLYTFSANALHDLETSTNGIQYYLVKSGEPLQLKTAEEANKMYFESYDVSLNRGLSLLDLGIADTSVSTYEEFRKKMFDEDFSNYVKESQNRYFFYAQDKNNIVGVSVVLQLNEPGSYYIDHIGVDKDHKKMGIGSTLMRLIEQHIVDWKNLSLDTRVFNREGQALYQKMDYKVESPHPIAKKQGFYLRYVKQR